MNFIEISSTLLAGATVAAVLVAQSRESSTQADPIPVRVNPPTPRRLKP